jgi:hypothetical protein
MLLLFLLRQVWSTSHDERRLIRAFQRRGVLPVAVSPTFFSDPSKPSWASATWDHRQSRPGCDETGHAVSDIKLLQVRLCLFIVLHPQLESCYA